MMPFFQSLLGLHQVSEEPLSYENTGKLGTMGNSSPIAYGGHITAQAFIAAYHSLAGDCQEKDKWAIYSASGNFLGPTLPDLSNRYRVEKPRDTRIFATRTVTASQEQGGKTRNCFLATFDFTIRTLVDEKDHQEARLPLSYTLSPPNTYPTLEEVPYLLDDAASRLKHGEISHKQYRMLSSIFDLRIKVAHYKLIKGQVLSETLLGMAQKKDSIKKFVQKGVTSLRQADYIKANEPLTKVKASEGGEEVLPISASFVQAAFLLFVADDAFSSLPLIWHGMNVMEAGVSSTLDFSVRFLVNDFDFETTHLREYQTYAARHERTFSEALIWNKEGRLVAAVSQTCIGRPKQAHL